LLLNRIVTSLGAVVTVLPTAGVARMTRGCASATLAADRDITAQAAIVMTAG
jgi:hypothetical protein